MEELARNTHHWDLQCAKQSGGKTLSSNVSVFGNAIAACRQAHALVILTEWDEFAKLDFELIYEVSCSPAVVAMNITCGSSMAVSAPFIAGDGQARLHL